MSGRITIASLVQEVVDAWESERDDLHPDALDQWVDEAIDDAIPTMTTTLFQMVVDDNTIAWIESDHETSEPFRCLSDAVRFEVTRLVHEHIKQTIEDDADQAELDAHEDRDR